MFIHFDADRPSESPFIERVWCCHSDSGGRFLSVASTHWEFVVTRLAGRTTITLRGPETGPREVDCPADGEWFAIRFKAGTFMPALPVSRLLNGSDVNLPGAIRNRFRLDGSAEIVWNILRWPIGVALVGAGLLLMLRVAPTVPLGTPRHRAAGALVALVVWTILTVLLGAYFATSTTTTRTYGPLLAVVALVLWSGLTSLALHLGMATTVELERS